MENDNPEFRIGSDNRSSNITERGELGVAGFDPWTYCLIIAPIGALGVLGNCFIVVFYRSKKQRQQAYAVYFRALAVSDNFVLVTTLIDNVMARMNGWRVLDERKSICSVVLFTLWFWKLFSSALLVVITADRYIAVAYPLKRATLCTFKRAMQNLAGTIFVCAGLSLPEVVVNELTNLVNSTGDKISECSLNADRTNISPFVTIYSSLVMMLPYTIIFVLNIRVIYLVRSSLRFQKDPRSFSLTRVTYPLVTVTLCSVFLVLPVLIVELIVMFYTWFEQSQLFDAELTKAWDICNITLFFNYAVNFYILLVSARDHRRSLKLALMCGNTCKCRI